MPHLSQHANQRAVPSILHSLQDFAHLFAAVLSFLLHMDHQLHIHRRFAGVDKLLDKGSCRQEHQSLRERECKLKMTAITSAPFFPGSVGLRTEIANPANNDTPFLLLPKKWMLFFVKAITVSAGTAANSATFQAVKVV